MTFLPDSLKITTVNEKHAKHEIYACENREKLTVTGNSTGGKFYRERMEVPGCIGRFFRYAVSMDAETSLYGTFGTGPRVLCDQVQRRAGVNGFEWIYVECVCKQGGTAGIPVPMWDQDSGVFDLTGNSLKFPAR